MSGKDLARAALLQISQDAAVNGGMERLDPPFQNLREIRDLGNRNDRNTRVPQEGGGAARRDDLDPKQFETLGEFGQICFVRHGNESPANGKILMFQHGS